MIASPPPQAPGAPDRGAATRCSLLAAAREVFACHGYAQASVAEIVTLAGASVGSLYHHFSGKADLYLTLYEQLQRDHAERTRSAVRRAREAGVSDPMQLFLAGARGYMDVCAEQQELARMFACGDGPPGFDRSWRERVTQWVVRNTEFFARNGEPLDGAVAIVMTGAIIVALAEMSRAADAQAALRIADGVIEVLSRLHGGQARG